jgi:glutamyl-tRNA synthetase
VHLGNARTALVAWLSVRSRGGTLVWRLEDLDRPRVVPGMDRAAEEDLAWLGLDWDESPSLGGPFAPYAQSERGDVYDGALLRLERAGRLFPCTLSRRDLHDLASAPHGGGRDAQEPGDPPYPRERRPRIVDAAWLADLRTGKRSDAAIRFRVDEAPVSVCDRVHGTFVERVSETVGDFVLRRRDGLYAYQLAVVADDIAMEIDDVVRGADLLDSTARQIQLIDALDGRRPAYAHVPLARNARGEKLSKRDAGLTLRALREARVRAARIVGYLACSLGLVDRVVDVEPGELVAGFDWSRVARADLVVGDDVLSLLRGR